MKWRTTRFVPSMSSENTNSRARDIEMDFPMFFLFILMDFQNPCFRTKTQTTKSGKEYATISHRDSYEWILERDHEEARK